jgi:hypothetical protein
MECIYSLLPYSSNWFIEQFKCVNIEINDREPAIIQAKPKLVTPPILFRAHNAKHSSKNELRNILHSRERLFSNRFASTRQIRIIRTKEHRAVRVHRPKPSLHQETSISLTSLRKLSFSRFWHINSLIILLRTSSGASL